MAKSSRIGALREDIRIVIGCLAAAALIGGSICIQTLQAQSEQRARLEQETQDRQRRDKAERDRKAQIETNAKAWIAWRDYIEPQCSVSVSRLQRGKSYRGLLVDGQRGKVYEGLILCDRNSVGILQGAMLTASYVAPRQGSPFPMPSDPPPPEFAPLSQSAHSN